MGAKERETPFAFSAKTEQRMTKPTITITEAKNRLPIFTVWRVLTLNGNPPAKDGVYHSPFREDGNPSFSIFANGTRFKDHATGESGDAITFYAMARNIENREAVKEFLTLAATWN
jgi:DNA primase